MRYADTVATSLDKDKLHDMLDQAVIVIDERDLECSRRDPRVRELYERGLWAMFASFNSSVLQFKLGFLADLDYCDEALSKVEDAIMAAKKLPRGQAMKLAGAGEGPAD